jgi:hypothetical protein
MNEILLSKEQTESIIADYRKGNRQELFWVFLKEKYHKIEIDWSMTYGTGRVRIKTETPEQLTWFLLHV